MAYMDDIIEYIKELERRIDSLERYGTGKFQAPPEVPTGAVNGSNTVFTVSNAFVTGSTQVYQNGLLKKLGTNYTETDPSSGEITFTVAPTGGDVILVAYKKD